MREYETVFIAEPNVTDAGLEEINTKCRSFIERNSGHLFFASNMGKRSLAYPIQKQTKGTYMCLDYASAGNTVGEMERFMRLDERVIRFLTIVKKEDVNIEERIAEVKAKGEDQIRIAEELEAASRLEAAARGENVDDSDGSADDGDGKENE